MNVEDAIALATKAHEGQIDKAGRHYILHPLRVMLACEKFGDDAMQVAVLHDVLEDTEIDLLIGYHLHDFRTQQSVGHVSGDVGEALRAITRRTDDQTYAEYIEAVAANWLATVVKMEDIKDNLRPDRRKALSRSQQERYNKSLARLRRLHRAR